MRRPRGRGPRPRARPGRQRTKNGADTKVCARTTATTVKAMSMPAACIGPASRPRRPNTSSSARPATAGGSTIGRSTIASTSHLPRNDRRASTIASGRPNTTVRTRLTAVVVEAQGQRGEDGRRADDLAQRAVDDRPGDERDDRQRQEQREDAREREQPDLAPRAPSRSAAGGAADRRRLLADGLRHDAGGRNPNSARIAWPSGPGEPVEERVGGLGVRRRLDDHPGVARRDVGVVGHVDRRDLVGRRGVGDVDDGGVALADLDLRPNGGDVVLLRDDVGGIGGGEVGRGPGLAGEVVDELGGVLRDRHLVARGDHPDPRLAEIRSDRRGRPGCRSA